MGGKIVVWMLARTPNSHQTPAHLPDIGGDIPAAAAHSSADLIKGIENKWGNKKSVHAYSHMTKTTFLGVKKVLFRKLTGDQRNYAYFIFREESATVARVDKLFDLSCICFKVLL